MDFEFSCCFVLRRVKVEVHLWPREYLCISQDEEGRKDSAVANLARTARTAVVVGIKRRSCIFIIIIIHPSSNERKWFIAFQLKGIHVRHNRCLKSEGLTFAAIIVTELRIKFVIELR